MENNDQLEEIKEETKEEVKEGSELNNNDSNEEVKKMINEKFEYFETRIKEWVISLIDSKKDNEEIEETEEVKERDFING